MANSSMYGLQKSSFTVMWPRCRHLLLTKRDKPATLFFPLSDLFLSTRTAWKSSMVAMGSGVPSYSHFSVKRKTLHSKKSLQFLTRAGSLSILLVISLSPRWQRGETLLSINLMSGPSSLPSSLRSSSASFVWPLNWRHPFCRDIRCSGRHAVQLQRDQDGPCCTQCDHRVYAQR